MSRFRLKETHDVSPRQKQLFEKAVQLLDQAQLYYNTSGGPYSSHAESKQQLGTVVLHMSASSYLGGQEILLTVTADGNKVFKAKCISHRFPNGGERGEFLHMITDNEGDWERVLLS